MRDSVCDSGNNAQMMTPTGSRSFGMRIYTTSDFCVKIRGGVKVQVMEEDPLRHLSEGSEGGREVLSVLRNLGITSYGGVWRKGQEEVALRIFINSFSIL